MKKKQNEDLISLKSDIDAIQAALNHSISIFNDEKERVQSVFTPLTKLSEDVEGRSKSKFT